jgi:hypothetical protein
LFALPSFSYLITKPLSCAEFDEKQKKLISDKIPINKKV